jgi:hypothetical protein
MTKFNKTACTETELRTRISESLYRAAQMVAEDRDSPADVSMIERLRNHAAVCKAELASRGIAV